MLRVIGNPFIAFDHLGRLSGVVRYDPLHGRPGEIHFVDAALTTTIVEKRSETKVIRGVSFRAPLKNPNATGDGDRFLAGDADVRDHVATHLLEGTALPHTDYFVSRILEGALIPIDEATHKVVYGARAGGKAYQDPNAALAASRLALIAEWKATYPEEEVPEWPLLTWKGTPTAAPVQTPPPAAPAAKSETSTHGGELLLAAGPAGSTAIPSPAPAATVHAPALLAAPALETAAESPPATPTPETVTTPAAASAPHVTEGA